MSYIIGDGGHARAISQQKLSGFVVAIGDNAERKRMVESEAREWGLSVHASAVIADGTSLGEGTMICAGAIICPNVRIGKHCIINTGASIDHDCIIGDYCHVGPHATLCGTVTLEGGVFCGAGSVVIQGRRVGEWSTVGAGGVVVKDVLPNVIVKGNPAC